MKKNNRVNRRQRIHATQRAYSILDKVQKKLRPTYIVDRKLVGSAKYNTIVRDENGKYDLDFQLILTHNSKDNLNDTENMHKVFYETFYSCIKEIFDNNKNEMAIVENSTSVITIRIFNNKDKDNKELFSFDFAILRKVESNAIEQYEILRKGEKAHIWEKLPIKNKKFYEKFYSLDKKIQNKIISNVVKIKIEEMKKPVKCRKKSMYIFIDAINSFNSKEIYDN